MTKLAALPAMLALALVGAGVGGQTPETEVLNIQVRVNEFAVASPEVRSTVIVYGLDKNLDQYLTDEEILVALNRTQRSIDNAETRYYLAGRQSSMQGNLARDLQDPGLQRAASAAGSSLRYRKLERLAAAQSMVATTAPELSLVDEEFHAMFGDLPGEQRAALLEADVDGNNDGIVTLREFHSHTRRLFRRMTRFEEDFGEEAYLTVLRRFGEL